MLRYLIPVLGAVAIEIEAVLQQGELTLPSAIGGGIVLLVILQLQAWLLHQERAGDADRDIPSSAVDRQGRRTRRELIERLQAEIAAQLKQSLNMLAGAPLGRVPTAEDYVLRRLNEPDQRIRRNTPIRTAYDRVGHRLLVLGEPGSGKTGLLLELVRSLLDEAQRSDDARVPVVFHLPSWTVDRRPLDEWLVDVLVGDHGVAPTIARIWLETDNLVPVLDELDQVADVHRAECVEAINRFHEQHRERPLVVSCRRAEYEQLPVELDLDGTIVIPLLTRAHVLQFVRRARRRLPGLWTAIRNHPGLCDLLSTPLLLSVAALTYQDGDAGALGAGGGRAELERRLWSDYVRTMLERRTADTVAMRYTPAQTARYLAWLARTMRETGQVVFYVDRLQPERLPTRRGRLLAVSGVTALCVLLYLAVTAVLAGLALWIAVVSAKGGSLQPWAVAAILQTRLSPVVLLAIAGAAGLALAVQERTVEPMRWSRRAFQRALRSMTLPGAVVGSLLATAAALLVQPPLWPWLACLGLLIGVGTSLWFAVGAGYESADDLTPAAPGRDVDDLRRAAIVNALVSVLIVGPAVTVAAGLALQLFAGVAAPPAVAIIGLFAVPLLALFTGLRRGGAAYARHRAVRWLLAKDECAARDIVDFLAYAAERNLLRRQGGGYEFVHPMLRGYFEELR